MKKILSVLAVMAVACSAFAQGQINFSSPASSIKVKNPATADAVNIPAAGGFISALWAPAGSAMTPWVADGGQNLAAWLVANPAWTQARNTDGELLKKAVASGRVLATSIIVPTTSPVDLVMFGWSGTSASFDDAYALAGLDPATATVGFSDKLTVTPTTAPSPPAVASFAGGLTMTPTSIVPEPSTFALAGLGAAALMILRRRN